MVQDAGKTEQDSLQATGRTSGDVKTPPSDKEVVEVFTKDDFEDWKRQWQSTKDKEIAELNKYVKLGSEATTELAHTRGRITELEEKIEKGWDDAAKMDPDLFDIQKARKELQANQKLLAEEQKQFTWQQLTAQEEAASLAEVRHFLQASQVAGQFGIDVALLMKFAPKGVDEMKAVAETLAGLSGTPKPPTPKPDSGIGSGAGIDLSKATPYEKIRHGLDAKK